MCAYKQSAHSVLTAVAVVVRRRLRHNQFTTRRPLAFRMLYSTRMINDRAQLVSKKPNINISVCIKTNFKQAKTNV